MPGKNRKRQWNNSGMTLLETMVAFLILLIMTLSFLGIIQFSSKMTMEAEDKHALSEELDETLARKDPTGQTQIAGEVKLTLDTVNTDSSNLGYDTEIVLGQCKAYRLDFPDTEDPQVTIIRFKR